MFDLLKLRKQAKIDYQQARGTAHKDLLQLVWKDLRRQQIVKQQIITTAQKEIKRLEIEREQKLRRALTDYLVQERLTDIPGIGWARSADILKWVYKGKLTDLHQANQLQGIGERTQSAINQWVYNYQNNFTKLLQEDFSGKQKITITYQKMIATEEQKIATAEMVSRAMQEKLDRIEPELTRLKKISSQDFYRALKESGTSTPDLEHYIQGVFAEWEAIPIWFKNVITDTGVDWSPENSDLKEKFVIRNKPDTGILANKNRLAILFWLFVLSGSIFLPFLSSEPESNTLPVRVSPGVITKEPLAAPKVLPSAEPTTTNTPSRKMTVTNTATVTTTATNMPIAQLQVRAIISATNVRANASVLAAVIGVVKADDILIALDISDDGSWYLVEIPDGGEGWVDLRMVNLIDDNEANP